MPTPSLRSRVTAALTGLGVLLIFSPLAQQASDPDRPARFKAEVDQVVVYASVYDENNRLASGLTRDNFKVFEDRVEQQLTYFGQDDLPSTVGLVIDKSGSMRDKFRLVEDAVHLFLSMSNPENELFLTSFRDEVVLEEDFTRDVEDIRDSLANIVVSGGTALYDAIYLAVDHVREGAEPRKAIIAFTDGEDKDSYYELEELLDKIQESDVQVHLVAFLDSELSERGGFFGIFKSEKEKIENRLEQIAQFTGGKAYFPEKIDQLQQVFHDIAFELRNQYRLAYVSSNRKMDGSWRRIDVSVSKEGAGRLKVRAKKGYFAKKTD